MIHLPKHKPERVAESPVDLADLPPLTPHAQARMRHRGVTPLDVFVVLEYGHVDRSHGDHRFMVTDRALLRTPFEHLADRLRGLCVVQTADGCIRTIKRIFGMRQRGGLLGRRRFHE